MAENQNVAKEDSLFSGSDSSDSEGEVAKPVVEDSPKTAETPKADTKKDDMDDLFEGSDDDDDDSSSDSDDAAIPEPTGKSAAGQVGDSSSTTTGKDGNSGEEEVDSNRPVETLYLPPRFEMPGDIHMIRTSRLFGMQPKEYDPETFDEAEDTAWNTDEYGNKKYLNVIRWRYKKKEDGSYALDEKGEKIVESNARLITWSDGTKSLQIGEEILDIDVKPLAKNKHWIYKQVMNTPPDGEPDTVLECAGDYVKSLVGP